MDFDLEYNSEREKLIIPEYGRHMQRLVDNCVAVEDREKRNKMARAIVDVMGNMQPHLRDVPDFQHKLWDQLFIMSNFKIDIDSPFDKPSREELQSKPEPLGYPKSMSKYRFYGHNIQKMIGIAITWEEGEKRDALCYVIANHMKKCYLNWNKDVVEDTVIFEHLYELSDGKIDLLNSKEELSTSKDLLKKRNNNNNNRKQRTNKKRN